MQTPGNASWQRPALVTRLLSSTCALSLRQARVLPPLHAFDIPPTPFLCHTPTPSFLRGAVSRQQGHQVVDGAGDPLHARITDPVPLVNEQCCHGVVVAACCFGFGVAGSQAKPGEVLTVGCDPSATEGW